MTTNGLAMLVEVTQPCDSGDGNRAESGNVLAHGLQINRRPITDDPIYSADYLG